MARKTAEPKPRPPPPDPRDFNAFRLWLAEKPREWSVVIAARAVLRVLPQAASAVRTGDDAVSIALPLFRATAIARFAAVYPNRATGGAAASASAAHLAADTYLATSVVGAARAAVASAASAARTTYAAAYAYPAASAASAAYSAAYASAADAASAAASATLEDVKRLDAGVAPEVLARAPLWGEDERPLRDTRDAWGRLAEVLRGFGKHWHVWIAWYGGVLAAARRTEAEDMAFVDLPEPLPWDDGPEAVNAAIAARLAALQPPERNPTQDAAIPTIPPQRPAAIEPIWIKGWLTVPKRPAKTDLKGKDFAAALRAVRAELAELSEDAANEANIDKRIVPFLRRLVERIPESPPAQDDLFRLGHAESIFVIYAKIVNAEWPDLLAARYRAITIQFENTMRQSPSWRMFKRNAAKDRLSEDQIDSAPVLAREAADALRQDEALEFVDPALPNSLLRLADEPASAPEVTNQSLPELLAVDQVESVSNTLKRIAEPASLYMTSVMKGASAAAAKQGLKDGKKAFDWLHRLAISAGGKVTTGSFVALGILIGKYPETLGWLQSFLKFLGAH